MMIKIVCARVRASVCVCVCGAGDRVYPSNTRFARRCHPGTLKKKKKRGHSLRISIIRNVLKTIPRVEIMVM